MTTLSIVPECYVDTKVVEIIGQIKKCNHQHSCGDVANELKNRLRDIPALGIIDEDKNKGPRAKYFSEFILIIEENNLILKKHQTKSQYLILICPEVEKWLLADAEKIKIDITEYGLDNRLENFVQISKIKNIDKNEGFYRFIKTLIREKSPSVTTFKLWIELFKENKLDTIVK